MRYTEKDQVQQLAPPETTYSLAQEKPQQTWSVFDVLIAIARQKAMIFRGTVVIAVLTAIVTLLLPSWYSATARMAPPEVRPSASSLVLGFPSFNPFGGSSAFSLVDPNQIYVSMLQGDTIGTALSQRFKLQQRYDQRTMVDTLKELRDHTDARVEDSGIIAVQFEDKDPVFAAQVANAYIEELRRLNHSMSVEEAGERVQYLSHEMDSVKERLAIAEQSLQKLQEKTGLLQLDGQVQVAIAASATARAQLAAKRIELQALRSYATEQNPDVIRLRSEIGALQGEVEQLERRQAVAPGNVQIAAGRLPSVGLDYVRLMRDVKYFETVYLLLGNQLEAAKIDQGAMPLAIKVVDKANPPDKRSWPKRGLIVLLVTLTGFIGMICLALARTHIESDPESAAAMASLRHALGLDPVLHWTYERYSRIRRR